MNFVGLLHGVVRRLPEHDAIVDGERRFSFRDFWRQIAGAVRAYVELGIQPGDRVVLVLPNSPEFLFFHFAALQMGAVSVPVKNDYRRWELEQIIDDCRPRLVVSNDLWLGDNAPAMSRSLAGISVISVDRFPLLPAEGGRVSPTPSGAIASVNYSYSGGGHPRGAVLTHGNHICAATGYARHQGFTSAERFLIILPMAHVFALSGCVNSGLIRGGALVILHRYTPKAIFRAIEEHAITVLSAVPAVFDYLVRFPQKDRYDLSSLRLCVTGGDFMPAEVQRQVQAALRAPVVQGYGLTECLPIICNPPNGLNKPGTLGIPGRRDIRLRIISPDGGGLPPGEVGEITIRSPTTMCGYLNRPRETAEILSDGWLRTGDWGCVDEDGYLHFRGLRKNILNIYGNKVDPMEVANCLLSHPAIAEAEVTGVPANGAPQSAPQIAAKVNLKQGRSVSEDELGAFLRERLAAYKVPGEIVVQG